MPAGERGGGSVILSEPTLIIGPRSRGKRAAIISPKRDPRSHTETEDPLPLMGGLFMVDTMMLSAEQRSAYLMLLIHAWRIKEPLKDDNSLLARIAGMTKVKFIRHFRPISEEFFEIADGYWRPNAGHIDDPQSRRLTSIEWTVTRKKVFERDGYKCAYCGKRGGHLECDHIIPISRGGSNDLENLTTACRPCNRAKSDMTVEEWRGVSV